jgi:hypothetical protein
VIALAVNTPLATVPNAEALQVSVAEQRVAGQRRVGIGRLRAVVELELRDVPMCAAKPVLPSFAFLAQPNI